MIRPTPEQIAEARRVLLEGDAVAYADDVYIGTEDIEAIKVLLAATELPTDEEIADAFVENIIPRSSERMAERRAERVRSVALTIREPVAATWPDEVRAAQTVRRFLGAPEGK